MPNRLKTGLNILFYIFILSMPMMLVPEFSNIGRKLQYSDFAFLALFAMFAYYVIKEKVPFVKSSLYIPMGLYALAVAISALNALNPLKAYLDFAGTIYLILIFGVVINLVKTKDDLRKVLLFWLAALGIVVACAFIGLFEIFILKKSASLFMLTNESYPAPERYKLVHRLIPRLHSILRGPDMFVSYLIVSIGLCLPFVFDKSKIFLRAASGALIAIAIAISPLSTSRLVVGILICVFIFLIGVKQNKWISAARYLLFSAAAVLILFLSVITIWEPSKITHADTAVIGEKNISINYHIANKAYYTKYGLQMIKDHPFIGVGSDNFNKQLSLYYYRDPEKDESFKFLTNDPHNTYLGILAQQGIFGLIPFLAILVLFFVNIARVLKKSKDAFIRNVAYGITGAVCALLLNGLSMDVEHLRHLWFILGLGVALVNIEK